MTARTARGRGKAQGDLLDQEQSQPGTLELIEQAAAAEAALPLEAAEPQPDDVPTDESPAAEPVIAVEATPVIYYRPRVTMPDGTEIVCQHKYLHETEKAAVRCGSKMAAAGQFVK